MPRFLALCLLLAACMQQATAARASDDPLAISKINRIVFDFDFLVDGKVTNRGSE